MGNSSSLGADGTGKKVIKAKLENSKKTGILNLSNQGLKDSSSLLKKDIPLLANAGKIKSLDLSGNKSLKKLPFETDIVFGNCLKYLKIDGCALSEIMSLHGLENLGTLSLTSNQLSDGQLSELPAALTRLYLSGNRFSCLPQLPPKLRELDISSNRLKSLQGIDVLVGLVDITLDDNKLAELPVEIGELMALRSLKARRNNIGKSGIPSQVFIRTSLVHLALDGNPLTAKDVYGIDGVQVFLERRKGSKDKDLQGGLLIDHSVFGLE
jgi:Leucine-rich repeat (LRR) protein